MTMVRVFLKKFKETTKIVADSALKPLIENGIKADIVVTDLDGDEEILKTVGQSEAVFVVHAHGDNIGKLQFVENFRNCVGTTQAKPFGKIKNFGGFTDGDRAVFLASHFGAKKIDEQLTAPNPTKFPEERSKRNVYKVYKGLLAVASKKRNR